ncbi:MULTISPECIES: lipopolysaccharide biosynthesis protein [Bacillus cereus group]|nr:lipopolysaccharide biosynthesis protein [Bacillus paranthracis]EJQ00886.1 hypothetical protein IC5_04236 [Bacillus cereus AND1407]KFL85438.1 polysaccharide biosynthesis family protein [Bacillus cereus]KMP83713.1 hypothetical protein TU64_15200 [Bacillus cereus]KMQ35899.1 hypothetical protein TU69_00875 [Bacillus cereus]MCC2356204.1 lipopolysaccharide biosynthesis protein [Bacillus paranthracis]
MLRSKRLAQNVIFYMLGMFATKLIQFLFVPLYTIYISSKQFGYFDLVSSIIILFVPLAYQSLSEAILRFTIDQEKIENSFQKIISTVLIYSFFLTLIYLFLSFVLFKAFSINYWFLIVLMAIGQMLVSVWQFSSRALKLNRVYTLAVFVSSVVNILVNILLIVVLSFQIEALFIANIAASFSLVLFIESKAKILRNINIRNYNSKLLKKMMIYSSPLALNASSWWILNFANRLIIINFLSLNHNGIYGISARIVTVVNLFTTVFNMAWQEEAFREYHSKDRDQYFNKALNFFTRFVTSCLMLLLPITYIIYPYIVHGEYSTGKSLMPIMYLSAIIAPLASHLGSAFTARKETGHLFTTTLIPGIISFVIGISLVNYIGLFSVAIGSLIGFLTMFLLRAWLLRNRMDLKIDYKYIMIFFVMYLGFSYVYLRMGLLANIISSIISFILFIVINRVIVREVYIKILNHLKSRRKK